MNRISALLLLSLSFWACSEQSKKEKPTKRVLTKKIELNLDQAENLIKLPLACVHQEYPNKLGQVLGNENDLGGPKELHPAFYGCFDWHSSVHGHWSLVKLIKDYPEVSGKEEGIRLLDANLTEANILAEVEYFKGKHNKSYERTYGWAWLLKLAEELHTWDDPLARKWEKNLQPLTDLIVERYINFLPKLVYPIRVGEHTNTAFGLSFAYDYAKTVDHLLLKTIIEQRAKEYYLEDEGCPLEWEPSGYDFLSPCLEEAHLMSKILSAQKFEEWLQRFLPQLLDPNFKIAPGQVSDRTDGKLVHLDGLNFSRAWCLNGIIKSNPNKYGHLVAMSNLHVKFSLPGLVDDSYEGGHWLGSFAIYALK